MDNKDVGILLQENNIKLQRHYFKEMCQLIGIQVIYRAPLENKSWDGWGELNSYFYPPVRVGCIFEEHPNQKTLKKRGWVAELQENSSLIDVPYDLEHLQAGALFIIPSGLDNAKGRVFKVISNETIAVFPSYITCEIAPVYEDNFDRQQLDKSETNMGILVNDNDKERPLQDDHHYEEDLV